MDNRDKLKERTNLGMMLHNKTMKDKNDKFKNTLSDIKLKLKDRPLLFE